jgi:heterodisulfide reductase subunit D
MDARAAAGSPVKVVDVVELMAQSMGLDTTIPENPYTKFQEQDVVVCDPVCRPTAMKKETALLVEEK